MEPPSPYSIPIHNEAGVRVRIRDLRRAIRATLSRHGMLPGTVSVLLTGNEQIQALNRDFRNLDEATDVLTFPASEGPEPPSSRHRMIGDIAISIDYAKAQAAARGVDLNEEVAYLGIHGALHLCGFDDETDTERRHMQIAMAEMGEHLGLKPDPAWTSVLHAVVEAPR